MDNDEVTEFDFAGVNVSSFNALDWGPGPSDPVEQMEAQEHQDALELTDKEFYVSVSGSQTPRSDALWVCEAFFGRVVRTCRDLVVKAIGNYPEHEHALKRWWKVYQQVKGVEYTHLDQVAGDIQSLLLDALKFDAFRRSLVTTMTMQFGNKFFRVRCRSEEDVPLRLPSRRSKLSSLIEGAQMHLSSRDSASYVEAPGHSGHTLVTIAIVASGNVLCLGPAGKDAHLQRTVGTSEFQISQVNLEEKKLYTYTRFDEELLVDDGRSSRMNDQHCRAVVEASLHDSRPIPFETVLIGKNSDVYSRIAEAAAFYSEGSRSIVKVGIVISRACVTFIDQNNYHVRDATFDLGDVSLEEFEGQLQKLVAEASKRFDDRLLAYAYHFLGERPGDTMDEERQAIVEALFGLIKGQEGGENIQQGWDLLRRRPITPWTALSAIENQWGIKLKEEPYEAAVISEKA